MIKNLKQSGGYCVLYNEENFGLWPSGGGKDKWPTGGLWPESGGPIECGLKPEF